MDENANPKPDLTPEQAASVEEAFKLVDADMQRQLNVYVEEMTSPLLLKSTPEQRTALGQLVYNHIVNESEDSAAIQALEDAIEVKVIELVTQELDTNASEEHDTLCDKVYDALDEAADETALYGQMKGHEMMGEMFGIKSTGPVRIEDGEVITSVAMGGAVRNPDGTWTEFGDDLDKEVGHG